MVTVVPLDYSFSISTELCFPVSSAIMEIDPEQIDDYYSVCESRIASLMQMEQPDSPGAQSRRNAPEYRETV